MSCLKMSLNVKRLCYFYFLDVFGHVLSVQVYVRKLEWRKHAELFTHEPKSRFIYTLKSGCHKIHYGNYGKVKNINLE